MIETLNLVKSFDSENGNNYLIQAVKDVSLKIREEEVFGLIGTNGAGKSTLLRMVAGVLKPDGGSVLIDREPVFDNPEVKKQLFFIADDPYFFPNSTAEDMKEYYSGVYRAFNGSRFESYLKDFGLDPDRRIANYSKGMKKQLAILCGVCAQTKYLLCDETFDGLDPVMRQSVKSIFANDMSERGLTPVISSHNLRELEDICDRVGLLHKGGVLLSEDIESMKLNIQKIQCVFMRDEDEKTALEGLKVMNVEKRGRLYTITVRGTKDEVTERFRGIETVFFEILPLTLEEVFISETEVAGYDVRKFILA
ncbi:MAG: ABC transporter ATP-binding protein [Lachnospiraceae bacterium]|jgi:ABC-2 type transport system ATP-binding protein|nr:ABC transporter ATP-binding protein [Lachnospiraceae bacterium]